MKPSHSNDVTIHGYPPIDSEGCNCGHKAQFCHKVNAQKWCGVTYSVEMEREVVRLKAALGIILDTTDKAHSGDMTFGVAADTVHRLALDALHPRPGR